MNFTVWKLRFAEFVLRAVLNWWKQLLLFWFTRWALGKAFTYSNGLYSESNLRAKTLHRIPAHVIAILTRPPWPSWLGVAEEQIPEEFAEQIAPRSYADSWSSFEDALDFWGVLICGALENDGLWSLSHTVDYRTRLQSFRVGLLTLQDLPNSSQESSAAATLGILAHNTFPDM